ncbi:MAG: glycosyltransferase family 2 protein [Myxococcaceae bacterium]
MQPLISHVITSFNHEKWIEETVRSAAEQSWAALEIVVCDDASSDGTPALIRELARQYPGRVLPFTFTENVGVTRNCNRALARCRGEFVSFQGGDDVLLPGKFEQQVRTFDDPRVTLSGHQVENFRWPEDPANPPWTFTPLAWEGDASLIVEHGPIFSSTSIMVRKSAIPTRGFDERLPMTSDWKFLVDCLAGGGRFTMLRETLARYRVLTSSVTRSRAEQHLAEKHHTLQLIADDDPSLAAAARRGQARLHLQAAEEAWQRGDRLELLKKLSASVRAGPLVSHRQLSLLGASLIPRRLVAPLRGVLQLARAAARKSS